MKINIKAGKMDLTPSLKIYIEERIAPLARFIKEFEEAGGAEAWIEVSRATRHHRHGDVFRAVVDLKLPKKILRAEEEADDIRAAVDMAKNTLRQEIEKYKTRFLMPKRARSK